jgi:GNAT superfamily N-acetyltransferase
MHTRCVDGLPVRPSRNGASATLPSLFARLGEQSRVRRFCGAKPRLSDGELELLARVDEERHVLVGYLDGDTEPAGIARLVREGSTAEVAFAVADGYQGRRVGSTLAAALAADARAAGITELLANVCGDNPPVVALMKRLGESLRVSWSGRERELVVGLES